MTDPTKPPAPITPEELEEMKTRCERASGTLDDGWEFVNHGNYVEEADLESQLIVCSVPGSEERRHANGEFIAHARTDLPRCLAEIERLRGVLQVIREAGQNQDMTAGWMQRWAAWGMDQRFPKPTDTPSPLLYPPNPPVC